MTIFNSYNHQLCCRGLSSNQSTVEVQQDHFVGNKHFWGSQARGGIQGTVRLAFELHWCENW